jgi:hypothetical protein
MSYDTIMMCDICKTEKRLKNSDGLWPVGWYKIILEVPAGGEIHCCGGGCATQAIIELEKKKQGIT